MTKLDKLLRPEINEPGDEDWQCKNLAQIGRKAQIKRIKSFIDSNLMNVDLRPQLIIDQLGLSRASLYRLTEPFGGVSKLITDRRLDVAHAFLTSEDKDSISISILTYEIGFRSEVTFRRSFKQKFGKSPRDLKNSS